MKYGKDGALNESWFNIRKVAQIPDESLERFRKTPIYDLLKERREFCREAQKQELTEDLERMFEMYNDRIKDFFLIKNN